MFNLWFTLVIEKDENYHHSAGKDLMELNGHIWIEVHIWKKILAAQLDKFHKD